MFITKFSFYVHHSSLYPQKLIRNLSPILKTDTVKINLLRNYARLTWKEKEKKRKDKYRDVINDKNLPYKIVEPCSTQLTQLLIAAKSRKNRYLKHIILIEGKRLIAEALKANMRPIMILFSRMNLIEDLPIDPSYVQPETTVLRKLTYNHMKIWSNLTTSPGIFGIFKMPNLEKKRPAFGALPITMVCDNIREPGNLGSILRVAAAIPVRKVILLAGCTDIWDSKVIRGSSGAMFYLNVQSNASWEDVKDTCTGNVIIADHALQNTSKRGIIPAEAYAHVDDDEESIMHNEFADEDDVGPEKDLREIYKLPLIPYYDLKHCNDQSYVVIIGGETHGLSEECFEYASSKNGCRVNIPLSECVNSLNAATALGIISFEMKRQILSNSQ